MKDLGIKIILTEFIVCVMKVHKYIYDMCFIAYAVPLMFEMC